MNNLYEFGGVCDVIVRCNSERTIGNRTYKSGEPYTILKDVYVNVGYRTTISDASAKNNVLSNREGLPDVVNISGVTLTDKVCNLIATKEKQGIITKSYEAVADDGVIYMPETYIPDSVYIYRGNELITDFTVENDKLLGVFEEGQTYLIFYSVLMSANCFNFEIPSFGYFSLDIIGKGNIDKKSKNVYISFPAVSLISVPVFDLVNGTILNAPLQFVCVHRMQKPPIFVLGD